MSTRYDTLAGASRGYYALLGVLSLLVASGWAAAHTMDQQGHVVTGMTNQVVWGLPHVFAVFLVLAASGSLNAASIASVFGRESYKPLARLSGLLAIALLVGGLAVLVLDLGRPDRLIVAMTTYNFRSIFAWNIFLYTGFIAVVAIYLWMMFEPRMNGYVRTTGIVAFAWRLMLTSGTGAIFGFLVARQAYDAAIMAPMAIAMSLSFGTAVFVLVLAATSRWSGRPLAGDLLHRLKRLLGLFVLVVLYLVAVHHLTNLYMREHHELEHFLLVDGGVYTMLFWGVQIALGSLVPLALVYLPRFSAPCYALAAAVLVIVGGFAQLYVIIIGGQAFPLTLFPGADVSSAFFDGVVASYTPSLPEWLLGTGGMGLALLVTLIGLRILPFLPERFGEANA